MWRNKGRGRCLRQSNWLQSLNVSKIRLSLNLQWMFVVIKSLSTETNIHLTNNDTLSFQANPSTCLMDGRENRCMWTRAQSHSRNKQQHLPLLLEREGPDRTVPAMRSVRRGTTDVGKCCCILIIPAVADGGSRVRQAPPIGSHTQSYDAVTHSGDRQRVCSVCCSCRSRAQGGWTTSLRTGGCPCTIYTSAAEGGDRGSWTHPRSFTHSPSHTLFVKCFLQASHPPQWLFPCVVLCVLWSAAYLMLVSSSLTLTHLQCSGFHCKGSDRSEHYC